MGNAMIQNANIPNHGQLKAKIGTIGFFDDKRVEESEAFHRGILNAIADEIAVLDADGVIVAVNESWRRFAMENSIEPGKPAPYTEVGTNYLSICRACIGFELDDVYRSCEGIQDVLDGTRAAFSMEYPCHSPEQERWFCMNVTPLDWGGQRAVAIVHSNITGRKLAEEALRAKRRRLSDIIKFLPTATLAIDEQGRVIIWNEAIEQMTGIAAAEMLGKGDCAHAVPFYGKAQPQLLNLIFADPDTVAARYPDVARRGDTLSVEIFCKALHGGKGAWIIAKAAPLHDQDGNIVGAIESLRDISERKLSETYGALGREILHILNEPGELRHSIQRILALLKSQAGFDAVGIRLQQGEDYPYFVQEGFSSDFLLTENSLIAQAADGTVCRDQNGKVKLECTCGLVLSGHTDPTNPLFTPGGSCWTNNAKLLLDIHATDDPRLHPRNQCIHHNYNSVALVPIRDKERIIGLIQFNDRHRDVFSLCAIELLEGIATHLGAALVRKQTEDETKTLQTQLLQAQKLEAIGTLAAGIAHEINSPVQYVGDNIRFLDEAFQAFIAINEQYARLLKAVKNQEQLTVLTQELEAVIDQADITYLLDEIPKTIQQSLDGVSQVGEIVRAMKEFSHPGTDEKVPVDINRILASSVTVSRNEWKYVADIETAFASALPLVPCLAGEISQVFLNLIVNAAHAIDAVTARGGKGLIRLSTCVRDGWLEIRIADSGGGIPEAVQHRIFDPFFTTKKIGKGTGQGLAIARSVIVDKHQGTIRFATEAGKGTTFIVQLPLR